MRVIINNFGPINKFEYDLEKDFIVTYGCNNIGKSYAMQIVYLLVKSLIGIRTRYIDYYPLFPGTLENEKNGLPHIEKINKILTDFSASSKQTQIEITETVRDAVSEKMRIILGDVFFHSCANTFGNFEGILEQKPIINIVNKDLSIKIDLADKKISADCFCEKIYIKRASSDYHKARKQNGTYSVYFYKKTDGPRNIILRYIQNKYVTLLNPLSKMYDYVFFLPASRSGIYSGMNAFSSIVAELSKNKSVLTKKIEFPGISEPISDYFLALSNINKRRNNNVLEEIYLEIEEKILKGKVNFNAERNTITYAPINTSFEFEMTEASSMVSEISPVVAFLKYIVSVSGAYPKKSGCIIFLEEPEAHLHPRNQIELVEIFSKLHRFNVKLIISSHSNYIFNKLNNLVLSGKISSKTYSPIILDSFSDGSISRFLDIDELGATDENFIDASEELLNERYEIIDRLNAESND